MKWECNREFMTKRKRNQYFDNMKAFLIFMVVLGHVISTFNDVGGPVYDWIYRVIFSFHMPVFIFVSGYFATANPKKLIARMLPLYLLFQIIQIFMKWLMAYAENPSEARFEFQLFEPAWTLWYLMALMVYSLILPLLDTGDEKKQIRNLLLALAAGLLIGFTADNHNFMAINRVITFLPFYLLGFYMKKYHTFLTWLSHPENRKRKAYMKYRAAAVAGAALLLVVMALAGTDIKARWFYGTLSYGNSDLTVASKLLTYLISGVWLLIILVLTPQQKLPIISKIGRNTLGIYLFHTIILRLLQEHAFLKDQIDHSLALAIALSVGLTLLLSLDIFTNLLHKIRYPYGYQKKYHIR